MHLPVLDASQPSTPRRRGWNEPRPAAITTVLREELGAGRRAQEEAAVVLASAVRTTSSPKWNTGRHRRDLLHQAVDEFLRAADGQRRDVVDRLVGIQLGTLAARVLERVDDVALDAEQAELEDLEQAGGAGADDQGVGFDGRWRDVGRSKWEPPAKLGGF